MEEKGNIEGLVRQSNIVHDVILLELERVRNTRREDFDLYIKDEVDGFVKVADGYDESFNELHNRLMMKKRMRYYITFSETLDMEDTLNLTALRIIRFLARNMDYSNKIKGYSLRDIQKCTGLGNMPVLNAMKKLFAKGVLKYETHKLRRTYMINPIYYYRGSIKGIYRATYNYNKFGDSVFEEQ